MNAPDAVAMPKMEMVATATVKPYWRNPRKNDRAVPAVAESIRRYGMNQPLLLDKKGVIIVGHTRYRACIELGVEKVPVIRATHLTAKLAREYRIADNKTGELAEWDRAALIPELRDTDLEAMALFFDSADLSKMLGEANGSAFRPVDAATMDRVLDRSQKGMADLITPPAVGEQIKLTCPHCFADFHVDRDVIDHHAGEA